MSRKIYEVDAFIVDANGSFSRLQNYPKYFDSKNNNDDTGKTERKAKAEYYDTLGGFYNNQANRQIQTVIMRDAEGVTILRECIGGFPADPEPEVEEESN